MKLMVVNDRSAVFSEALSKLAFNFGQQSRFYKSAVNIYEKI